MSKEIKNTETEQCTIPSVSTSTDIEVGNIVKYLPKNVRVM